MDNAYEEKLTKNILEYTYFYSLLTVIKIFSVIV